MGIVMGRSREEAEADRITNEYKALRSQSRGLSSGMTVMMLAKKWKRPAAEINRILERTELNKKKAQNYLDAEYARQQEAHRIEDLGQHEFVTPHGETPPTSCAHCYEPEHSRRHELGQERLI